MNRVSPRILRRLAVVLAASLAALTLMAAPSGADEAPELGPRAELVEATAKPPTFGVNSPGAPVRCEVGFGNDVTIQGGTLNVTWAVACRWTDDGQLSSEVADITVDIVIRKNGQVLFPLLPEPCVEAAPSTTCSHRVGFDGTGGRYDSLALVTVTWNDGFPPIQGLFRSPGFVLT